MPKTAEPIQMNCSGAEEGTMFSASKAQNPTWLLFAKHEGCQENETRLEPGRQAELHLYWDKAKEMVRVLGCGNQPSKAVEFPTLSVDTRWFVHFFPSPIHSPEWP